MELCPKDLYSLFESRLLHNLDPNSEYSSFAQRSISLTSMAAINGDAYSAKVPREGAPLRTEMTICRFDGNLVFVSFCTNC